VRILGIDPGMKGGWAVLDGYGHVVGVGIFPLTDKKVDYEKLFNEIEAQSGLFECSKFIERPIPMPKQNSRSTATAFEGFGIIKGMIKGYGVWPTEIPPRNWKKMIKEEGFPTKGKEGSFAFVEKHFPHVNLVPSGCRKPSDGIADALCIAEFGRRSLVD